MLMSKRKLSKRVRQIMQQYLAGKLDLAKTPKPTSWEEMEQSLTALDDHWRRTAPWFLTTLVNVGTRTLYDKNLLQGLRHMEEIGPEISDNAILSLAEELRNVWLKPPHEIMIAIDKWFQEIPVDSTSGCWLVLLPIGVIRPFNLPGILARAVLQYYKSFAQCKNDACYGRLFVQLRKSQKYCLLTPECRKYGHNQAAKNYYLRKAAAAKEIRIQ